MKTVNFCLDRYQAEHVAHAVVDKQRVAYCLQALRPFFGRRHAEKLCNPDIRAYAERRKRQGIGAGTVYREVACLIAALRYSAGEGYIKSIPALRRPKKPPARTLWLTRSQVADLLEQCGERARLFVLIAIETGGRPEAIDQLTWTQVDLEQRLIYFNRRGRAQTSKRRPTVPISDRLYAALATARAEARTPYVLGSNASTWKAVRGATRRAGLTGVTRKTLRHTWATWAAQRGVSLWDIAGVLGTTVPTAERNYAHHAPDYLREAING